MMLNTKTNSEALFEANGLLFRIIRPGEPGTLNQATTINNSVWGEHLGSKTSDFKSRAANGYVIGAFRGRELLGTISGIGGSSRLLNEARKQPEHHYNTWNGITSDGTFANPSPNPDILFCVAVTTAGRVKRPYPDILAQDSGILNFVRGLARWWDREDYEFHQLLQRVVDQLVNNYCNSGLDYVIRFQQRAKADGLLKGAKITDILKDGRPKDLDSFGYNVIMQYPEVPPPETLPAQPEIYSIGEGLVIAAAYLASRHPTLRFVMPYSRPAQFRANLIKALVASQTEDAGKFKPGFRKFIQDSVRAWTRAMASTTSK